MTAEHNERGDFVHIKENICDQVADTAFNARVPTDKELGGIEKPVSQLFPESAPYCDVYLTPKFDYDYDKAVSLNCDSDDDKKRVVRSHKDKQWDKMEEGAKDVRDQIKQEEWVKVEAAFDNLNKLLAKAAALVAKEGIPPFYFKLLVQIEETVDRNLEDKAAVKKLAKSSAKSLNSLKQVRCVSVVRVIACVLVPVCVCVSVRVFRPRAGGL